jgi:hypothetical protein
LCTLLSQANWFLQLAVYGCLFCSSFSRARVGWVIISPLARVSLVASLAGFSSRWCEFLSCGGRLVSPIGLRLWLPLRCEFLSYLGFIISPLARVSLVASLTGFSSRWCEFLSCGGRLVSPIGLRLWLPLRCEFLSYLGFIISPADHCIVLTWLRLLGGGRTGR